MLFDSKARAAETFEAISNNRNYDIWEYVKLFASFASGNVLEIGTREGASTAAFLVGVARRGGHVYSVDINDCSGLYQGHPQWTFIQADSVKQSAFVKSKLPSTIRVLFVDGDHSFAAVLSDLEQYSPLVEPGGFILVHDVNPDGITPELSAKGWIAEPGCRKAFDVFCAQRKCYIAPGRAGLGVIFC